MKVLRWVGFISVSILFLALCAALVVKFSSTEPYPQWVQYMSDPNLFTGLSSFIISFVAYVVASSIEVEKIRAERREKIRILEDEIDADFIHAIEKLMGLEKESRNWEKEHCERLKKIRNKCDGRDGQIAFLFCLGRLLENDDAEKDVPYVLDIAKKFYKNLPMISTIEAIYNGQVIAKDVETLLRIWDDFDVYSADVVVNLLERVFQKLDKGPKDSLKEQIESTSHRNRLIRYQKLKGIVDSLKLTLPDKYHYYDPLHPLCAVSPTQSYNTYANLFDEERIVDESWVEPVRWKQLKSTNEPAQMSALTIDSLILLRRLWKELTEKQNNPREGVFLVYWDVAVKGPVPSGLEKIAYQVAETWVEFLPRNPDAFLDLRSEEREVLLGYLGWYMGSVAALLCRLKQRFLWVEDNNRRKKEMSVLFDKMARFDLSYNKDYDPREGQLLDWLSIRPPWLISTILILIYHESPALELQQVLSAYQKDLQKQKIFTKELLITQDRPVSPGLMITWADDNLMEMLKLRVQRVSRRTTFTSLFVPPDDPKSDLLLYDKMLVQKSQGSLGRLLELGRRILDHHAQYRPDIPDLLPYDFAVINES